MQFLLTILSDHLGGSCCLCISIELAFSTSFVTTFTEKLHVTVHPPRSMLLWMHGGKITASVGGFSIKLASCLNPMPTTKAALIQIIIF